MIEIINVIPTAKVVGYKRTDGDIAYVLFFFDLDLLYQNLVIKVLFSFRQDFDVDPEQI
jgi:hypothetical protein